MKSFKNIRQFLYLLSKLLTNPLVPQVLQTNIEEINSIERYLKCHDAQPK